MAGLFDFKSAEQILQERMDRTEQNRLEMLKAISQGAPRPDVARLGANLGYILGKSLFGGKSEKEQLKDTRDMGETTQAMEQAGVGGEGSAQFDGEGSSYGAGVLQQAKEEEKRRLGLLPEKMQQAERVRIGMERTPEDLDLVDRYRYMAKVFQDAGFTARAAQAALLADKEAQRQLERGELTKYQQELVEQSKNRLKLEEDKLRYERNLYGGGTGAGGGTPAGDGKSYKPGDIITDQKTGKQLVVGEDGKLIPKDEYDARKAISGYNIEPSTGEKIYNFFAGPFEQMNRREILGQAQMVSKALKEESVRPRDIDAMRDLVKLPQEESGLTPSEYNIATNFVKANPE